MEQIATTEVICGVAKKFSLELEKQFPLHSHAAVVSLMNIMVEHRQANVKTEQAQKQQEAYERQVEMARNEQKRQESDAERRRLGLVTA